MEKLCKNCKYWSNGQEFDPSHHYTGSELREVHTDVAEGVRYRYLTEAEAKEKTGRIVRNCINPKLLFYERPAIDGAAVYDGSQYMAGLITGEEFGCVNFEPKI